MCSRVLTLAISGSEVCAVRNMNDEFGLRFDLRCYMWVPINSNRIFQGHLTDCRMIVSVQTTQHLNDID